MLGRHPTSARSHHHQAGFGIWRREVEEGVSLVAVKGELDLSSAPRLKWMLVDALQGGFNKVVLDLSFATFMDSTALGVLVAVKRRLSAGERLAIVCPNIDLLRVFQFAGMDEAFAIRPTLDEALAHLRGEVAEPDRER